MSDAPAAQPLPDTATTAEAPGLGSRFTRLWLSSGVSNLGDGLGISAVPLLAASLTRDPALVAGLMVASGLPWLLFSAVGGVLIDRLDRRAVLVAMSFLRAVLFAVLTAAVLGDWISLPLLYAAFFVFGTAEMMFDNAAFAILPAVVGKAKLERANGRLFVTHRVTNEFVGPPLGSHGFALLPWLPLAGQAIAFAAAGFFFRGLKGDFRPRHATPLSLKSVGTDLVEGFRWFWAHRIIRNVGLAIGAINFAVIGGFAVLVLYAQDVLGMSDAQFGYLLTAGAVGGVLGGLVAAPLSRALGAGGTVIVAHLVVSGSFAMLAMTDDAWVAGASFAVFSFFAINSQVVIISFRQAVIPDRLLGRITSVFRLIAVGVNPLGAAVGGLVARHWGVAAPFWIGAVMTLLVTLLLWPSITNRAMAAARADAERP